MSNSLTRITRYGFVNAHLVAEDGGLTLIDTTMRRGGQAILAVRAFRRRSPRAWARSPQIGDP